MIGHWIKELLARAFNWIRNILDPNYARDSAAFDQQAAELDEREKDDLKDIARLDREAQVAANDRAATQVVLQRDLKSVDDLPGKLKEIDDEGERRKAAVKDQMARKSDDDVLRTDLGDL